MDIYEYVDTRRKRYLGQTMEHFETTIEPLLDMGDPKVSDAVRAHKATTRRKFQALQTDATDAVKLGEKTELNGFAVDIRDRLHPEGRP